ncbi:hypothetical protein ACFX1R_002135 [Malus domestica]
MEEEDEGGRGRFFKDRRWVGDSVKQGGERQTRKKLCVGGGSYAGVLGVGTREGDTCPFGYMFGFSLIFN